MQAVVIILVLLLLAILAGGAYLFLASGSNSASMSALRGGSALRASGMSASPSSTGQGKGGRVKQFDSAMESAAFAPVQRTTNAGLTLVKRLKYGQWTIPPIAFYMSSLGISVVAMSIASTKLNFVMVLVTAFTGPLIMNSALNFCVERPCKAKLFSL